MTPADFVTVMRGGVFGKGYPITEVAEDGPNNFTYIGVAPRGSLTSDAAWIVERVTTNSSGNLVRSRVSPDNSIFDNYASLDYR